MIICFALNTRYNFRVLDRMAYRFMVYAAVTAAGYLFSTVMLLLFVRQLHMLPIVGKLLTLPLVFVFQYTLNKRFTFDTTASSPALQTASEVSSS
jgi:putative flippase GtrA